MDCLYGYNGYNFKIKRLDFQMGKYKKKMQL